MRIGNDETLDLRAQVAAYLRARYEMSQQEIAEVLGDVSQSQVSRLLDRAVAHGWFRVRYEFNAAGIPPRRMREIENVITPKRLRELLAELRPENGVRVRGVRVFDSGGDATTPEAYRERLMRFRGPAGGRIDELLSAARVVAVGFGETLESVIKGLAGLRTRKRKDEPIQFIPVFGEPVDEGATEYSSSRLADILNEIVNERKAERLSLAGVPLFIPKRFQGEAAVRKFAEHAPAYQRIFAGAAPLIAAADTFLTSIGRNDNALGRCNAELLKAAGIGNERLQSLVVGDLGSVLIPAPGPKKDQKVAELNALRNGVQLPHLEAVARRAAAGETAPGIVVTAIGRNKAAVLCELVHRGLVNELIVDHDLAAELQKLLQQKRTKSRD